MRGNFFENLKKFIMDEEDVLTLIPYYETLLQQEELLQDLLEDTDKYFYEIAYRKNDKRYSDGKFTVKLYIKESGDAYFNPHSAGHSYEIELLHDKRGWNYCECTPDMEGYNPFASCCGNGCDWVAPLIHVTKIIDIVHKSFEGVERDMWKLASRWDVIMNEHKKELKNDRLELIDKKIERLEIEKRALLEEDKGDGTYL